MLLTRRGIGVLLSGAAIGAAWFAIGIRDLWYLSAFLLALVAIALVTVLNVVGGIGRLRMETLVRGVMPFFLVYLMIVGLLIAVPSIITVPLAWLR